MSSVHLRSTKTARLWIDGAGILHVVATGEASTPDTVADTLTVAKEMIGGGRAPIVFDARLWPRADPKAWVVFINMIESVCVAAGVVVGVEAADSFGTYPPLLDGLVIPFRVFSDKDDALAFLRPYAVG